MMVNFEGFFHRSKFGDRCSLHLQMLLTQCFTNVLARAYSTCVLSQGIEIGYGRSTSIGCHEKIMTMNMVPDVVSNGVRYP
jgi:hypothetical protein